MFTLNRKEIAEFRIECANEFIAFWCQFYKYRVALLGTDEPIDYYAEMNTDRDLTEENVRRLLRWKDPHQLTHRILSGRNAGRDNHRVVRVLRDLDTLNRFRRGAIAEEEIRNTVSAIFPKGMIFRVFLLHIAAPHSYPIADQHVFRACSLHTRKKIEQTWQGYMRYTQYFSEIANAICAPQASTSISQLKRIDNALMAFGQFLKSYYR